MSRSRTIVRTLWSAACGACALTACAQTPPVPWPATPAGGDPAVAAWAAGALRPAPAAASQQRPAPPAPQPVADPFAAAAASPPDRYAALPPISAGAPRPEVTPMAAGNPLRAAAPSTAAPSPARDPFAAAAPRAFQPNPAAPAARIEVGATAVRASKPEPPVRIPMEAAPTPVRVASAESSEPAAFNTAIPAAPAQPAWPDPVTRSATHTPEGLGQPGPPALEGPQRATLTVEKRAPDEVQVGRAARFAVRVRNGGDQPAENVVLVDRVPAGSRLVGTTPAATREGDRLVWRLGTLPPGDDRTVEIELEPTREGPIGSVATVTMDASASATTRCTRPQIALRVVSEGTVQLGEVHSVTIEVHNPGSGTATGVMLLGDVPPQVSHPAGRELEFEVGALAAGETRRIDLRLTAQAAGRVASPVRVVADGGLAAERPLEFEVIAPSLAVTIDGPTKRYLERPASYTIGVDNPGTAPARDVRLVTHLPRGMEFVRANNLGEYDSATHSVYWSLAELPQGERGEVEVVAVPVAAGEHTLTAESESADGLRAEHTHRVAVDGVASLAFEVRDLADPVEVGQETVYEVRVLNEGTKAATGVRVAVEAPAGGRLAGAEGPTEGRTAGDRAEFAPLAELAPGEKVTYRVRVVAAAEGDQRVAVLVSSDGLDRPIRREESTRVFGDG